MLRPERRSGDPVMSSFLSIGECMIELADAGDGLYRRGFAGDTFNTAWYARKLLPENWLVSYGSCIGTDPASHDMAAFMAAQGIDTDSLRRVPDRTVGLYMISLEGGERSFSYWRGLSAARLLADDPEWLAHILSRRDLIYFSGITLAILAPEARQAFCQAVTHARKAGATVAFDTNLRPGLWESEEAMRSGMLAGASVADIVLPSFDDEATLFGDSDPGETIDRYRGCGASIVAVKNGSGDLVVWDDAGTRRIPPVARVTEIDTTAAGDSFGAALLAGIATGKSTDNAAQSAMALAAVVVQHRGALVPDLFQGVTR